MSQVVIGAIFFEAARRKYRRDDAVGMGPVLGLMLLAAFVGVSWAGIWYWDEFGPRWLRSSWEHPDLQMLCSLVGMMLLAMVPVAAAAKLNPDQQVRLGRESSGSPPDERSPWRVPHLLVVAAATAIISMLVWVTRDPDTLSRPMVIATRDIAWRTSLIVLLCLVSFSYVARAAYRHARWPRIVAGGWVLSLWLVPIMVDLVRFTHAEQPR